MGGLDVPAEWVAQLTQGLEEVMNAESLELQAVFRWDPPGDLVVLADVAHHGMRHRSDLLGFAPVGACEMLLTCSLPGLHQQPLASSIRLTSLRAELPPDEVCELLQFTAMVRAGQITDLRCFYDPDQRCLHAVVRLGR